MDEWFDERREASIIVSEKSYDLKSYDKIYEAVILGFKRQRAALISSSAQPATATGKEQKQTEWTLHIAEQKRNKK